MKIYFLSEVKAALKLDGEYVGIIDGFERWCDVDCTGRVLAEIIPENNLQPVNFFICEEFFRTSHGFADVYTQAGSGVIYLRDFIRKDASLKMVLQRAFCGITVTVYRQCSMFVSCEGKTFENYPLPDCYQNARAEEVTAGGHRLLALYGGSMLTLINGGGKIIFSGEAESCSFGNTIEIKVPLHGCCDTVADCVFTCDGEKLTAVNSHITERVTPDPDLLPFLFFERILHGGDFAAMLDDGLRPKAGSLKKYLGDFTAVTVPSEDFYTAERRAPAAGLVFPKGKNVYEVVYFAVDVDGGKITNIRPV